MSMTLKIKDSILSNCRHKLQRHCMKMLYSMILVARCKCSDNGVDSEGRGQPLNREKVRISK